MKEKFFSFVAGIREYVKGIAADVYEIREEMFERHPFILGHIEGCIVVYWALMISGWIARIFFKKQLGWVDKK